MEHQVIPVTQNVLKDIRRTAGQVQRGFILFYYALLLFIFHDIESNACIRNDDLGRHPLERP